jgi:hypothetical protein
MFIQTEVKMMKQVSKWLLTGTLLAVAFGCQPKKSDSPCKERKCGQCSSEESRLEKEVPAVSSEEERASPSVAESEVVLSSTEQEEALLSTTAIEPTLQDSIATLSAILEVNADTIGNFTESETAPAAAGN